MKTRHFYVLTTKQRLSKNNLQPYADIDPFIYTKCILATSLLWGKSRAILDSPFSGCEDFVVQEWESHDSWQGGVKYD